MWKNKTKSEIAENCRIIGCKWVFRVKNDGLFCAQLCAIGYTQGAGVDFQDKFALVVNNVDFWIAIFVMMTYCWDADIVDIQTAFLYGNLGKSIFMKLPEGLAEHLDTVFDDNVCLVLVQSM